MEKKQYKKKYNKLVRYPRKRVGDWRLVMFSSKACEWSVGPRNSQLLYFYLCCGVLGVPLTICGRLPPAPNLATASLETGAQCSYIESNYGKCSCFSFRLGKAKFIIYLSWSQHCVALWFHLFFEYTTYSFCFPSIGQVY